MRRSYRTPAPDQPGTLRFVVELERQGEIKGGETLLQPLAPLRIAELLGDAGFRPPLRFAGWEGMPFNEDLDLYCITVARI